MNNHSQPIYPENFEAKLGFDKIRQRIKNYCLSSLGKEEADAMHFLRSQADIAPLLEQTQEFVVVNEQEAEFPLSYFINMQPALEKIRVAGVYMDEKEVFDLKRSLDTIKAIVQYLKRRYKEDEAYPRLHALASEVNIFPLVHDRIRALLNSDGHIRNNASPDLKKIRSEMAAKEASMSKEAHRILNQAKKDGVVDKETTLTVREGKMLIPVPAAHKRKISGYVHDESATGKTAYIEPGFLFEMNNQLRELYFAERREIIRILKEFADFLRPYIDELLASYHFLGRIEFIRAKALLARDLEATLPELRNQPFIDLRYARHPLLWLHFKQEKREVVPMSLQLDKENRMLLISGPNAGGKSVCLQTVGLLQYMLQSGLLVPVKDTSRMGIFQHIFIDMGDEQSIENDLSTYSSHLSNMRHFTEQASLLSKMAHVR